MATSGSTSTTINSFWKLELHWKQVGNQDIANNRTTIEAEVFWGVTGGSNGGSTTHTGTINIGGQTGNISYNSSLSTNQRKSLGKVTKTITHDNSGKKTITISASVPINLTLNGKWVGTQNMSLSATLNDIPRASTITTFNNFTIGNNIAWAVDKKHSSYTHWVRLSVGSTIIADLPNLTASSGTFAGSTYKTALLNTLSKTSKTLSAKLEVWTYKNATQSSANLVGVVASKTATGSALDDDIKPNPPSITTSAIDGLSGEYVESKSKIRVQSSATFKYGATASEYRVTVAGNNYYGNDINTAIINSNDKINVVVRVMDTRGVSNTNNVEITFRAYSPPQITKFNADRVGTNETNLSGDYAYSISSVNNKNAKSYTIEYRQTTPSVGAWTSAKTGTANYIEDSTYSKNGVLIDDRMYEVRITVSDSYTSTSIIRPIYTAYSLMDFNPSGKGLAIGGMSTGDKFEVFMPTEFASTIKDKNEDEVLGKPHWDNITNKPVELTNPAGLFVNHGSISNGTNFNNLTASGFYTVPGIVNASNNTNMPMKTAGILSVYNNHFYKQVYTTYTGRQSWERVYYPHEEKWSPWRKSSGEELIWNGNLTAPNAISADFSRFRLLRIVGTGWVSTFTYMIDLTKSIHNGPHPNQKYVGSTTFFQFASTENTTYEQYYSISGVNEGKTTFWHLGIGYLTSTGVLNKRHSNNSYVVTHIYGIE